MIEAGSSQWCVCSLVADLRKRTFWVGQVFALRLPLWFASSTVCSCEYAGSKNKGMGVFNNASMAGLGEGSCDSMHSSRASWFTAQASQNGFTTPSPAKISPSIRYDSGHSMTGVRNISPCLNRYSRITERTMLETKEGFRRDTSMHHPAVDSRPIPRCTPYWSPITSEVRISRV